MKYFVMFTICMNQLQQIFVIWMKNNSDFHFRILLEIFYLSLTFFIFDYQFLLTIKKPAHEK